MGKVVKRSSEHDVFNAAKLRRSVKKAAEEAGLSASQIKDLIREVAEPVIELYKEKRLVKAVDLRRSILGRLSRRAKKVVFAWRRHDRKKRKR